MFEDSKSQRIERGTVERMLGMISVAGLDEAKKEAKEWCYNCWKNRFRSLLKPFAQQLGKDTEGW